MKRSVIPGWEEELRRRKEEETLLSSKIRQEAEDYSGLKDVEDILTLSLMRFSTALMLLDRVGHAGPGERDRLYRLTGEEVRLGKALLEDLLGENLALGERDSLKDHPLYREAQELFKKILLAGGAGFFDPLELPSKKRTLVSRAVAAALKKYARPDDNPAVLFAAETLPPPVRRFLHLFFPVVAPENLAPPPYGIPEGEEEERTSPYLVMPLSQGILYLEEELLPETEAELRRSPGDPELQGKLRWIRETLAHWKRLTFIPRATPVLLNQDFYTQGLSQYTPEGEPLVRFALPVRFSSGTNLDRYGEMVRAEVVRRLSGKGVCPDLDKDLRYRKSLASGRRGSSRTPSFKLDLQRGFRSLKRDLPALACLEEKDTLAGLLEQARKGSKTALSRKIEGLLGPSEQPHRGRRLT